MKEKTSNNNHSPVFVLPMLERDIERLEPFMAQQDIPWGLPLFELRIQLSFCQSLLSSLCFSFADRSKFTISHNSVVGCLNLLLKRLILIDSVFSHGKACCVKNSQMYLDLDAGQVFDVDNQISILEKALVQPGVNKTFPLAAVSESVDSCVSALVCMLACSNVVNGFGYFAGKGDEAVTDVCTMIEEQIELVIKALIFAQDNAYAIKTS